jgi:hypothetical protein
MTQQHPITPPPELVEQWIKECDQPDNPRWQEYEQDIASRAAQWGADCELEKCCEVLNEHNPSAYWGELLRSRRRPKPPRLKEQALQALAEAIKMADDAPPEGICSDQANIIRRALEQLDD